MTEEDTSPKFTPALTTSSHETVIAPDDPFLHTPNKADAPNTSALSSFLFPSRSFEIEQFANIKDVVPEWDDDEVDEIMILSPRSKLKASLSVVDESQEILASLPSVASFKLEHQIANSVDCPRVCVARHTESSQLYVIKTYSKSTISYDTPILEHAMKEQMMLRLLTQMNVRFFAKLRWSFQDKEAMHIVTDFYPNRSLASYIERHGPVPMPDILVHAAELIEALSNLHSSEITHRRVRPEHILLDAAGHIVLTGFSNASFSSPNSPPSSTSQTKSQSPPSVNEWDAPEVVLGWPQDCAIDIWSFGLVLWFMLSGKHLLTSELLHGNRSTTLHSSILSSLVLHATIKLDGEDDKDRAGVCDLIARCLQRNARLRPSASDIKTHPYFEDIDWNRLRKKQYTVNLPPYSTPLDATSISGGDVSDLPESETLRGVHIAGFDFVHDNSPPDQSLLDLSEGDFISREKSFHFFEDAEHSAMISEELRFPLIPDKRTTIASVYVTPAGSFASGARSAASSDVPSSALYSCTSFGELRESLNPGSTSTPNPPKSVSIEAKQDKAQSPQNIRSVPMRRASDSICPIPTSDSAATLTRRDSAPATTPPSILRRDTTLSHSTSRTSVLGLGNTSRPPSALSLGGARGLRLRKYASLNFDLDTVVSLDNDDSIRPMSLNTSRRVSFVDSLKNGSKDEAADVQAPVKVEGSISTAPFSAPIGSGHPWSFRNLNGFKVSSPAWHLTPGSSNATPGNVSGLTNAHNKLKKKQRTSSTPVLSAMAGMTPRLQDKVDLPEGLKQIGLGIGYTHTPSRISSPRIPGFTPGGDRDGSRGPQTPTSTPGRRTVPLVGTTSAIQRCASIFSGLRHGKQGAGGSERRGQGQLDALVERASEESDALEAVMREMYGASWTADGGSPPYGGRHGGGQGSVRKAGKVYSVPGMPAMTETLTRVRAGNATSSTLRLVEQTREEELRDL